MKIIVADDYYTNRLLVLEILNNLGHDSLEAENGQEALNLLKENKDIDLVLMDIEMPIMNGIDAMRFIREKMDYPLNKVPIIAVTAHSPNTYEENLLISGFDYTLVKPYSIDKIAELLDSYRK